METRQLVRDSTTFSQAFLVVRHRQDWRQGGATEDVGKKGKHHTSGVNISVMLDGEGWLHATHLLLDASLESEKLLLAHVALNVLVVGRDASAIDASLLKKYKRKRLSSETLQVTAVGENASRRDCLLFVGRMENILPQLSTLQRLWRRSVRALHLSA